MEVVVCLLIGYAIGTISPAYIIGAIRGFDIRKKGSGNAGASNVMIVIGKAAGIVCALLDIVKPCIAIWITRKLFPLFELVSNSYKFDFLQVHRLCKYFLCAE